MGICAVGFAPEGGNFDCLAVLMHNDDAKVLSQLADDRESGRFQQSDDLFGAGGSRNIKVAGDLSQQQITYSTANYIGLMALLCQ